jgi:GMP synthase-like glutamine amidotransferase
MKRIHILQHEPYETPGCIDDWIKQKSYNYTITELYKEELLPDVREIDWLVVMGGSMSVHDTEKFPWLKNEKSFIREAVSSGKVVAGICLGSQLIAEVLGGRVYKNISKEIGWFPVVRCDGTAVSRFPEKFNNSETVFHWHGDTFDMPEGAFRLFASEACRNQGFVYNEKVIGLQFHVEVTEILLENMIVNGIDEIVPEQYIQNADQLRKGSSNIKRNNELMYSILDELDKL